MHGCGSRGWCRRAGPTGRPKHSHHSRTGRCAACGYQPSTRFPHCRSHIVARALYQHSQITELPPAENETTPAHVPAVDQLSLFPAKPHANGTTRP
jgi:ribosomal protein L37E